METIIVASSPEKWTLNISNTRVVSPRKYITDSAFARPGEFRVLNLCNAFKYQNMGYYVSLLARARMHRPEPSVRTIIDFGSKKVLKFMSGEVEELAGKTLFGCEGGLFELDVYFGRSLEKKYERLARSLFALLPAPMFKAFFRRKKSGLWALDRLEPISSKKIEEGDRAHISRIAAEYLARRRSLGEMKGEGRYSIGILVDKSEAYAPSNEKALSKFAKAAAAVGFDCEFFGKEDFGSIGELDALFIRATTNANNFTYAFARQAEADGVVVMDDTNSIIRCANKVFQTQLAQMKNIPIPKTVIVHKGNLKEISQELSFPIVIKQPDSQFSQGVFKASNEAELASIVSGLMRGSDLLIAQEFVPTRFDWRVGIFNKQVIFACKYYMAEKHWQIINSSKKRRGRLGDSETIPVAAVPKKVRDVALKMSNLIGDGLYGVDVKECEDGRVVLIEVNDNPNIDAGIEDRVLKDELYMRIMQGFMQRVEALKNPPNGKSKNGKPARG